MEGVGLLKLPLNPIEKFKQSLHYRFLNLEIRNMGISVKNIITPKYKRIGMPKRKHEKNNAA
jgi:hypothetical protein